MTTAIPVRLGPAEDRLIDQLKSAGAIDAAQFVQSRGLPTRKVENYHYTDLKTLLRDVPPVLTSDDAIVEPKLRVAGSYRILDANGDATFDSTPPNGIIVSKNSDTALTARDDVMVHLNRALSGDTIHIKLEGSVDPVVHVDHRVSGDARHLAQQTIIEVAAGATAVVLETFAGSDAAHLTNSATRVIMGEDAQFLHVTVDLSERATRRFANVEYTLADKAQLTTLALNIGAGLSRTQLFGRFEGAESHADFTGMNLVEGGQLCDVTLDVTHAVPHTTSTEVFKSVVRDDGVSVFQGRIAVDQDAQKTDAKMMSKGLMLSDEAQILVKPELEIFADDVQCGHGATCGDLNEDWLFYLMSRGVPRAEAESILTRAFLQDLLDQVEHAELNEALRGVVDEWLG